MNLKDQRNGLMAKAQNIMSGVGERPMTADEKTELKGITEQVKDIDRQIAEAREQGSLFNEFKSLVRDDESKPAGAHTAAPEAKSLGEHFAKFGYEKLQAVKGISGATVTAPEFKASNTDTISTPIDLQSAYNTQFDRTIVQAYRRRAYASDLLSAGTLTNANAIAYLVEGPMEGTFGMVPEGGAKPQLWFGNPDIRTDGIRKIAAFMKFTDEMIEDWGFLVSEINNRALYLLALKEEEQILWGDGTGQNLLGLMNRSGIQVTGVEKDSGIQTLDELDTIFKATTLINNATGLQADGVVMNPMDYQKMRLAKDNNYQYFGGGPFQGEYGNGSVEWQRSVWGLNTVVTPAMPQGKALVAAFKAGKTLYRKGGVRVETTNSHVDDFTNNLVTTRIEERIGLADRLPSASVVVNLMPNANQ